jgi:hypothetical protein
MRCQQARAKSRPQVTLGVKRLPSIRSRPQVTLAVMQRLVASMVCAHLSPPPSIEAPLIDRLWELSDRALSPKAFAEVVASPLAEWFL